MAKHQIGGTKSILRQFTKCHLPDARNFELGTEAGRQKCMAAWTKFAGLSDSLVKTIAGELAASNKLTHRRLLNKIFRHVERCRIHAEDWLDLYHRSTKWRRDGRLRAWDIIQMVLGDKSERERRVEIEGRAIDKAADRAERTYYRLSESGSCFSSKSRQLGRDDRRELRL